MAGVMIAAPKSGSGKTMITCGLLKLLDRKGWNPAPFKCGPDYIDGLFHNKVLGLESGNLDSFFEEPDHMREKISRISAGRFVVAEGVMGYFDGLGGISAKGSTWEISQILELPVILVVDAKGASLSLAAQVKGFLEYVPRDEEGKEIKCANRIGGILFNRISPMIYGRVKALIEEQLHVPVIGYVPELDFLQVGSRHLGLVLPDEIDGLKGQMERLADCMEKTVNLDVLSMISGGKGEADELNPGREHRARPGKADSGREHRAQQGNPDSDRNQYPNPGKAASDEMNCRQMWCGKSGTAPFAHGCEKNSDRQFYLGVALDEAFCFYYRDNLTALEHAGARLVYFSPLRDETIPDYLDGLLFGGGYPENYAGELAGGISMRSSVADAAGRGMPILGECGGYLYLLETLQGIDGKDYPMAGVLPGRGFRGDKKGRFGYITLSPDGTLPYILPGMEIKGHEFHYWDCECGDEEYRMTARKPVGGRSWRCMRTRGDVMAGFPHLYYPSCPGFAERFADRCIIFGRKMGHES